VHLEDVVAVGHRRLGIVRRGQRDPFFAAGHGVDEVALADQADGLAVRHLHALEQFLEVLRIAVGAEGLHLCRTHSAGWLAGHAALLLLLTRRHLPHGHELLVLVDGVRDLAQPVLQLDLFLPPQAEACHRQGDRGQDADDRHDGDQFGDRETGGEV
jgi:hypothetical protein